MQRVQLLTTVSPQSAAESSRVAMQDLTGFVKLKKTLLYYCRGSASLLTSPSGMRSPLLSPRCHTSQQRMPASPAAVSTKASLACAADIAYTAAMDTVASTQRRSTYDDSYDSAAPMSVVSGWERVEEDLGIDEGPGADPQEWEEMVSLLSFDGEEHKRVMR